MHLKTVLTLPTIKLHPSTRRKLNHTIVRCY